MAAQAFLHGALEASPFGESGNQVAGFVGDDHLVLRHDRRTSIRSTAFLSDCNKRRAMLVFVVTKNTLAPLRMAFGQAFRAGCAMAGAKAHLFLFNVQPD